MQWPQGRGIERVKHVDVIYHFTRDHVVSGELKFLYCRSADNV
ncbi:MAG: hypothetical protein RL033_1999, partial [Pseudomonadota bacterium]